MDYPPLRVRHLAGVPVVGVGEHAAGEPMPVGEGLLSLLDKAPGIILDMAGVEFLGSAFLGLLITASRQARAKDRKLVLCCPPGEILEVLNITRLDGMFPSYPTLADALRHF